MRNKLKALLPHGIVRYRQSKRQAAISKGRLPQNWSGAPFDCEQKHFLFDVSNESKVQCITKEGQTRVSQRIVSGQCLTLKQPSFASAYLHLGITPASAGPPPQNIRIFVSGRETAVLRGPINADHWTFVRVPLSPDPKPVVLKLEFEKAHDIYVSSPIMGSPKRNNQQNIIVLIADSLQPTHLGYHRIPQGGESLTPYIDRFFANGKIYRNAFSQGEWTLASLASMATGLYGVQHGVYNPHQYQRRLPGSVPTMAESLNRSGYKTFGYSTGRRFLPPLGHFRGYDQFYFSDWFEPHMGERVVARGCEFIEVHQNEPFFCFLHFYDPHPPFGRFSYFSDVVADSDRWAAPEKLYTQWKRHWKDSQAEDRDLLEHLHKAGEVKIRQLDYYLSRLFEHLSATGLLENTTVILTADHGRMYKKSTRPFLKTELTHVPLMVLDPSCQDQEYIERYTEPCVDLYPTAMDCARLPHPKHLAGNSLFNRTARPNAIARSESLFQGNYELVLRNRRWCYAFRSTMDIQTGLVDLQGNTTEYLFTRDDGSGWECYSNNLLDQESATTEMFRQMVSDHLRRDRYYTDQELIEW